MTSITLAPPADKQQAIQSAVQEVIRYIPQIPPSGSRLISGAETVTARLAQDDPLRAGVAVTAIKSLHTLIFLGMGSCVLNILYSGLTGRISRLTKLSLVAVVCEALIFIGNGRRCPLTNLAEDLGSEHGTVGDIFLPDWFARRIPVVSSTLVVIGLMAMALRRLSGAFPSH